MSEGKQRWAAGLLAAAAIISASFYFWPESGKETKTGVSTVGGEQAAGPPNAGSFAEVRALGSSPALAPVIGQSAGREGGGIASGPLPEDWEGRFFDILELDSAQAAERNSRLITMATVEAQSEPRVQQECLRHLAYGLPDSAVREMLRLSLDPRIPGELRAEFVESLFGHRPQESCLWLARQLQSVPDASVAQVARDYLGSFEFPADR